MLLKKEKSIYFFSLLRKESGLEADFMGYKGPSGNSSDIKDEAGNLTGTGRELLWKIRGERGKATVLVSGKGPGRTLAPHGTCQEDVRCQCCNMNLPIVEQQSRVEI